MGYTLTFLVYSSQSAALADISIINAALGYTNANVKTITWSIPLQRLDGNWCFPSPIQGVQGLSGQSETFQSSWFPAPKVI